ncbi:glycosyltransferase family 4 protein [Rhizobium sp. WYJ-E13]|uniref:glycosyltransferase family 4 protein n=1 Tax=unclassified Rhizobium TaxID=2613769 RepID=UPI001C1EEF82|nr:glycosyltransferase family 4 protein [Rhizobium sp. WYJ-E13]QWW71991.1 glycosyltransferase family 4 protein [Rhizobium sp. WYJ-E13]
MKVLVSAHRLEIGGTQVNSIELAAHMRDRYGHDIVFWAQPGPMLKLVEAKGLKFIPAPDARVHPSLARMKSLRTIVREEVPDLIHAWDWWQGLDVYLSVHLPWKKPLVITDMMMGVSRVLPKTIPTTFGTPFVVRSAKAAGWRRAELLLPPVDVEFNAPGAVDASAFRQQYSEPGTVLVVTVARLAALMKLDSLLRAIDAVQRLNGRVALKLIIVGDGTERARLEALARQTNELLKREAVVVAGPMVDPRPAYAAADIVIGMGGSALRGMAFAKPVIVVGEQGFAQAFLPETRDYFYDNGMFGQGDPASKESQLASELALMTQDGVDRDAIGVFGRDFVVRHYSLDAVGAVLDRVYRSAAVGRLSSTATASDAARTMYMYLRERRFSCPSRER